MIYSFNPLGNLFAEAYFGYVIFARMYLCISTRVCALVLACKPNGCDDNVLCLVSSCHTHFRFRLLPLKHVVRFTNWTCFVTSYSHESSVLLKVYTSGRFYEAYYLGYSDNLSNWWPKMGKRVLYQPPQRIFCSLLLFHKCITCSSCNEKHKRLSRLSISLLPVIWWIVREKKQESYFREKLLFPFCLHLFFIK